MKNRGWTFLCHHGDLLEYCYDFKGRVDWIKKHKPLDEWPARLAAFRFVKGKLPDKLLAAWEDYDKYVEARAASRKARIAYLRAYDECYPAILELFRKECPDTNWDEKNKTLVLSKEKK